jgi:ribosome assembly protein YihI (activator of Der GTPase)
MTIYISKYIHVEVPDYEIEVEIEPEEALNQIDSDELLDHVIDNCDAETILSKVDSNDIVNYITQDKASLSRLLRKIADNLDHSI